MFAARTFTRNRKIYLSYNSAVSRRWLLAFLTTVLCIRAETGEANREAALRLLRDFSENYGARLQSFTCNKAIDRATAKKGAENHWKHVDRSEEEIYYVARRERRKLVSIDGKPANGRNRVKHGMTVGGEFGLLGNIFSKQAKAAFTWDHQQGDICVWRYTVAESDAPIVAHVSFRRITLGHHGIIYAGCETGVVSQLDTASDREPDKGIEMNTSIRFAPTYIGDRQFQLPQKAEDISRSGSHITRASVSFGNYRKYEASSDIHFEEVEK